MKLMFCPPSSQGLLSWTWSSSQLHKEHIS